MPRPVWLDSGGVNTKQCHHHIFAAAPSSTLYSEGGITYWQEAGVAQSARLKYPLRKAAQLLGDINDSSKAFPGGWIGYLGYDLARYWLPLSHRSSDLALPDLVLGRYDWVIVLDQVKQQAKLLALMTEQGFKQIRADITESLRFATQEPPTVPKATELTLKTSKGDYVKALAKVFDYIFEGDCYQINYAQRFDAKSNDSAADIYRHLRAQNPAPYAAYLDFDDFQVLSSSPERFLTLKNGCVETKPIKGTRPRYIDPKLDAQAAKDLLSSEKDRAENLMIVDLLRNDLGRVCVPGSIKVDKLFDIESFATVHHLVSTVSGQLRNDCDIADLFHACFPGGSITGAPKIRAMQIIDELEPVRREVYCGSVIRWGYDGSLDSSISIRTLVKRGEQLHYWAGGGIVADSQTQAEYQESLTKAAAFLDGLQLNIKTS